MPNASTDCRTNPLLVVALSLTALVCLVALGAITSTERRAAREELSTTATKQAQHP